MNPVTPPKWPGSGGGAGGSNPLYVRVLDPSAPETVVDAKGASSFELLMEFSPDWADWALEPWERGHFANIVNMPDGIPVFIRLSVPTGWPAEPTETVMVNILVDGRAVPVYGWTQGWGPPLIGWGTSVIGKGGGGLWVGGTTRSPIEINTRDFTGTSGHGIEGPRPPSTMRLWEYPLSLPVGVRERLYAGESLRMPWPGEFWPWDRLVEVARWAPGSPTTVRLSTSSAMVDGAQARVQHYQGPDDEGWLAFTEPIDFVAAGGATISAPGGRTRLSRGSIATVTAYDNGNLWLLEGDLVAAS